VENRQRTIIIIIKEIQKMKKYNITVNGTTYQVEVEEAGGAVSAPAAAPTPAAAPAPASAAALSPAAAPAPAAPASAPSAGAVTVTSPMPGTILDIKVKAGDPVNKGQLLFILEAMKMENEIFSPSAGTIETVQIAKGASVNAGEILLSIK
jgi:glutaconyl-CoA/methylmalonyl-CoA decarboxylase subunit gamma